ncbi:unnamed protein product, partial [Adineta steineri]
PGGVRVPVMTIRVVTSTLATVLSS